MGGFNGHGYEVKAKKKVSPLGETRCATNISPLVTPPGCHRALTPGVQFFMPWTVTNTVDDGCEQASGGDW